MDLYSGSIISFNLFLNLLFSIPSFLFASFAALQRCLSTLRLHCTNTLKSFSLLCTSRSLPPSALTCTCCKILESIVASDLIDYLNEHHLIKKAQHGFLRKHSTITNSLESTNDWTLSISKHRSVAIAYIDFQRAFDSVSHPKLLHKLTIWNWW